MSEQNIFGEKRESAGYLINSTYDSFLDCTKFKAFADDKLDVVKITISVFDRVKNILGKMRKCWLQAFPPFSTVFSKGFFLRSLKVGIVW